MTNPVTLTLTTPQGAFVFADAEVPEKIAVGGEQLLTVHKLVGGLRVLDAMGPDDSALSWSGWFLGASAPGDDSGAPLPDTQSATGRARFLDGVRRAGLPCTLSWGEFSYQVVVSQFAADYEKPYKVAYRITCEVVQDQTQSVSGTASGPTSPTDAIAQDSAALGTLASSIGSAALSGLVGSVASALSAVTGAARPIANGLVSLGSAASGATGAAGAAASALSATSGAATSLSDAVASVGSAVSSVTGAVASASSALSSLQSTVSGLAAAASAAVAAIPSIGGASPLQSVVQQAAAMSAQATAAVQLSTLQQMSDVAARLQSNLALVANPGGNRQVTTGGGNLYQAAAQAYGDATRWSDIAQASGLTDPMTPGFNTINIP